MSYKNTDPCLQKAYPDEMLFVLMARDATAPDVIDFWIILNRTKQPAEKLAEARQCAQTMRETRGIMVTRKESETSEISTLYTRPTGHGFLHFKDPDFPDISTLESGGESYIHAKELTRFLDAIVNNPQTGGGLHRDTVDYLKEKLLNNFK